LLRWLKQGATRLSHVCSDLVHAAAPRGLIPQSRRRDPEDLFSVSLEGRLSTHTHRSLLPSTLCDVVRRAAYLFMNIGSRANGSNFLELSSNCFPMNRAVRLNAK
jgi:hypothetical protein